jgi:hypothetical protein
VDRLTKSAHFIHVSTVYRVRQYAELYMSHIICYHSILKTIIFVGDLSLLLVFWSNCMRVWAPTSSKAQLIISRLTDRLNESIKSSKICFVLVF